ncbi:hypothetical protein RIF29_32585 [Crotalaria pallida]|uniref:Transmembrane protein n=1 Tax=Crotalaria pallida TaxID=3830 RepID=A0AAN9EKV3_CROPI
MAITLLLNLWPFSFLRPINDDDDDQLLKASKKLVSKLPISDHTKQFVFAFRDPQTNSLVYILSSLHLSQRSSSDAHSLITHLKPDAVIIQSSVSPFSQILSDEKAESSDFDFHNSPLPTSSFGVLKRCFLDKIGRDMYETLAANFVLREIFGTSFHGHLLAAKKAADDVGSQFIVIESPLGNNGLINSNNVDNNNNNNSNSNGNNNSSGGSSGLQSLVSSSLVPQQQGGGGGAASLALTYSKRFCLDSDVRAQMEKALSVCIDAQLFGKTDSVSEGGSVETEERSGYETPSFAKSVYPLLEDLHNIFSDLPSIGKALANARRMLLSVNRGEALDSETVSEVYTFRIAVEGLRIALNNSGLQPINRKGIKKSDKIEFSELPVDDKAHVLFANAIRSQTDKFKTVVAVVDAGALAGLRKHWNTPLPGEVKELVGQLISDSEGEGVILSHNERKRSLTDKAVVAVGAGATAVLGASSLTKVVPASTLMKFATFKVPASFKIIFSQAHRALAFALGPSKAVAPGFAASGAKTSSAMKAAVSAEKIRAVAHSIIASAEKTSISVTRTAFYEIMRKRKVRSVGFLPYATLAASVGTCTGLLWWGDGIECAVESLPSAPSIASLGRGIQHLHEASQSAMQSEGTRIQKSIESLINRIKKAR